ncbi:MAG: hypothetical protein ACKO9D_14780 [Gammaproteobacteria bacterium]
MTPRLACTVAAALSALTPSMAGAQPATGLDRTHPGFCAEVQRRLTGTTLPVTNVVETTAESFKKSKPSVQPVRTHQHLGTDADGRPMELSCKTKSADHLRSVHGAAAAGADRSCRDLHRDMVDGIWRALPPALRARAAHPPWRVMLDADSASYTGSSWIKAHATATRGADDRLHLRAAGLFAEWEDWRWKIMPESFRGNHYCHLVAPERIRRLMLGDAAPQG